MADTFSSHAESLTSPPSHLVAVTPDDGQDLPAVSRALNVAASGAVQITTAGGDTVSVTVAAGVVFPVRARRIWAAGTTATGIVAMY